MARIDLAWELGGHTGHVATMLPLARALRAKGHEVRFLLKNPQAGGDLEGMTEFPREPAPHWVGPVAYENPQNFGEILHNFGYQHADALRDLVAAWRERLEESDLVVANVAPAAHLAALTLGIPSLEVSQGFHIPPPTLPSPPLRHWQPVERRRLEEADGRVLSAIAHVLRQYGKPGIETIGGLFEGRAVLLTYPELDIYPERGPADYYGIPSAGEGAAVPAWPKGAGPRVFSYLYGYYAGLPRLLDALKSADAPTLMLCRNVSDELKLRHRGGPVSVSDVPMSVSRLLPECDLVVCHGSHQMTAQALLAGRPVLLLPTQLEQFLITRRIVRHGAGLGIAPDVPDADFAAALREVHRNDRYARQAREFQQKYAAHRADAALARIVARCEAALG